MTIRPLQTPGRPDNRDIRPPSSTSENWDRLAKFDAMWTVLSDPERIGGKWDPEEFFATGADVLAHLKAIEALGIQVAYGVAVDFGCGLGRVSQWLAKRFSHVIGIDISPQMLAMAESYNRCRAPITFVLGNEQNVPLAAACADFVHSVIALQHIPRALQAMYLREFSRIVRPGGYLYFQTPSHVIGVADEILRFNQPTPSGPASIEIHAYPRTELEALLEACGCDVVWVFDDQSCGPGVKSHFYLAQKRARRGAMTYNRDNPSPAYRSRIAQYRELHMQGEQVLGLSPDETYPGLSMLPHTRRIKELIDKTGARTVLDYGCGKGYQYDLPKVVIPGVGECGRVIDYWDIDEVCCYDPCVERYSRLPEEKFDGVVSTDVLGHCIEDDIPWIVAEMFAFANLFVFASVACYPAKTTLPNGENAHTTVRPLEWWKLVFTEAGKKHPQVMWKLFVEEH